MDKWNRASILRIFEWMKVMTKQQNTVRLLLFELWSAKFLLLCCCSRTVQYKELQIGLWMKQHYSDTVTGNHVLCCRKLVSGVSQCHYDIIVIVGSLQGQNAECVKYACVLRFTPTAQSAGKTSTWLNCCLMRFERHKHPNLTNVQVAFYPKIKKGIIHFA